MCCCSCYAFLRERGGGEMGGREMREKEREMREKERDTHREREREREIWSFCLNQTCFIPSTIKDEIIQKVIKTAIFVAIANNTLYGSKL